MFTRLLRKCLVGIVVSAIPFCIGCNKGPASPTEVIQHSFAIGDWGMVVSMCDQVLERNPDDSEVILMRGRAYLGAGDLDAAVRDFSRRIELMPEDPEGYYHRQIAYRELGQPELAATDGEKARRFDSLYKSAYAFEPSNFIPQVDLTSPKDKPVLNFDSVSEQTAYEEPIYSDEANFEPDATSRALASGESKIREEKVSEGDIGIPRAPQIVHQDSIPQLSNPNVSQAPDDVTGDLAELKTMRFPANPTQDDPTEPQGKIPDIAIDRTGDPPVPRNLSTSLPKDPGGNVFVPGSASDTMSTGLQTKPPIGAPRGLENLGALPTGLNAPQSMATGLNAPRDSNFGFNLENLSMNGGIPSGASPSGESPSGESPNGMSSPRGLNFNGRNAAGAALIPTANIGLSGFPLPQGSTGLPAPSRTAATNTGSTPPPLTATPNSLSFRGHPVFGPNQQPVISNSLPGYSVPNSVANPVSSQSQISTRLSDAVLQDRLNRPTSIGTGGPTQLRSLQQQ